jgi:hypothetical protein
MKRFLASVASLGMLLAVGLTATALPASAGAGSCSYGSVTVSPGQHKVTVSSIACTGGMVGWAWAKNTAGTQYKGGMVSSGSSTATYTGTVASYGFSWG